MSIVRWWQRSRLVVGAAVASVVSAVALVPATPASATEFTTGNIAVSSPQSGKVAANTGKQVIILTLTTVPAGVTISEDGIASVSLGAEGCEDLDWYIVTGTTQIAAKTPEGDPDVPDDDGCAPTASTTVGETITITFANATNDTWKKTGSNLFFVTPPAIADADDVPVFTENSMALDAEDRTHRLLASGNQYVRITAATTYGFSGGTAAGLAVSIGGKAATEVKAWSKANPTTALTGAASNDDKGNTLSFKTATGMTASASPLLTITANGVSKTFNATATGLTIVAAPVVTAVSPATLKAGATTTVTLTGTGFASGTTATVCGVTVTPGTPNGTGTSMTVSVDTDEIVNDADGLGLTKFSGVCPVVLTAGTAASPINDKSWISIISE
jgi:hypothetical protein